MRVVVWLTVLALLAVAGAYLIGVAARERTEGGRTALASDAIFEGLQSCDVPGLRERVIGRGNHTVAYAGEFTRASSVPWVTGKSRIFLFVLTGHGTVMVGNAAMAARPGDFFQLPAGVRHAVRVNSGSLRAFYVEDEL